MEEVSEDIDEIRLAMMVVLGVHFTSLSTCKYI